MNAEITLVAAFITGLLGSVHCIGMCGGIISSLSIGISPNKTQPLHYILLYNLGRLTSYTVAGLLVASLGKLSNGLFNQDTQQIGILLSGIFMILLGLYIAGWWKFLTILEVAGSYVWQYIQPLGNRLLPVKTSSQALMLGTLWGWLPCGMVYTMLVFALSSQDVLEGGLIMLSFGLGTLPTLLLLGSVASAMKRLVQQPIVRQLAGSLILLFGVYNLITINTHEHSHANHQQFLN